MKKLRLIPILAIAAILLSGCAGMGDWKTEPLPGGYEVWRCSVHVINLILPSSPDSNGGPVVIPSEIYALSYNDAFICAQHEDDTSHYEKSRYWDEPHGEIDYYILSIETGTLYGPYSESEYAEKCAELQVGELCEWIRPEDLPRAD